MVVLILISVALLVWGFAVGFEANGGKAVEVLLYWTYAMVCIALVSWVVIGLIVSAKNNPKSLVKMAIVVVGIAALVLICYLLAAGKPAMGMLAQPSAGTLKLTDTILNLTYVVGAAAIIAIIVGEVRMSIANKK